VSPVKRALTCIAIVAMLGCRHAGGGTQSPGAVTLSNDVHVVFEGGMKKVPFDTRQVRLRRASEQLAAVAGHRIEFHVDRAVMPQYEETFEEMLIRTLEAVATDLADLRGHAAYSDMSGALARIRIVYDVTVDPGRGWERELALEHATLTVRLDGVRSSFVPHGLVRAELLAALPELLRRRYEGVTPDALPPPEHALYFDYVQVLARGPYGDRDASATDLEAHGDLEALELAQALHERAHDDALTAEVARWIADHGGKLFYTHLEQVPSAVAGVRPDGAYARGRARWAEWTTKNMWSLAEPQRSVLLRRVFAPDPEAYTPVPGLEPMRVGLAIADRWIAEGHPGPTKNRSPGTTYDEVVCPVDLENEARHPFRNHCREIFYRHAWHDETSRERLVAELLARGDEPLYRAATAALMEIGGKDAVLDLWRRVERDERAWRAVGSEVAVLELAGPLLDDLQAMWRKWPQRRGTLLYAMALHARSDHHRRRFWPTFREDFGTVDATTFRAFLEHGPYATATAWVVWPALGRFDRGTLLAPRLGELLDAEHLGQQGRERLATPLEAITAIVERMCSSGTRTEREALETALDARMRTHPDEAKALARPRRLLACQGP
jgi:hypothetical protein